MYTYIFYGYSSTAIGPGTNIKQWNKILSISNNCTNNEKLAFASIKMEADKTHTLQKSRTPIKIT